MKNLFKIIILSIFFIFVSSTFAGEINIYEKKELRTMKSLKWTPNEIVVKFKDGVKKDKIDKFNNKQNTKVIYKSKYNKFLRLKVPKGKSIDKMIKTYSLNEDVLYAEPNYMATAFYTPNDEYYNTFEYQWNFKDQGLVYNPIDKEWKNNLGGINVTDGWDLFPDAKNSSLVLAGNPSVIVAVVDTGVAYTEKGRHYKKAPDLFQTIFVSSSDMYDFINSDNEPLDDEGHGTHVTGTIAQSTNNEIGVAGIAFNTMIMPIKVLNSNGSGSYAAIADGIVFAADHGAKVINLSLGGPVHAQVLKDAIDYAYYRKGVMLVCASGNDSENDNNPETNDPISYPAFYDECFTVAATRFDGQKAYYSSEGEHVDISAPGGDVTVDQNGDGYGDGILQQTFGRRANNFSYYFYQGTSMATPHVAGLSALLLAKDTSLTVKELRKTIEMNAKPLGEPEKYGSGLINVFDSLTDIKTVSTNDLSISSIEINEVTESNTLPIKVGVSTLGYKPVSHKVSLSITPEGENDSIITFSDTDINIPNGLSNIGYVDFSWSFGSLEGEYILKAYLEDSNTIDDYAKQFNSLEVSTVLITTPPITEGDNIYVNSIDNMIYKKQGRNTYVGKADVYVGDKSVGIAGAIVEAVWSFTNTDGTVIEGITSDVSDSTGLVQFTSGKYNISNGDTFTLTIINIILDGYTFNNEGSSRSINVNIQ